MATTTRKHTPQRTCIACRNAYPKRQLRRFVSTPDGVMYDPSGKQKGRGAYLCQQSQCLDKALMTPIMANALRTTITDIDRQRIRDSLS